MPEMSPTAATPAAPPQAAGAAAPKPPFGSTPAVTPGQNQGLEMAAVQQIGVINRQLTEILAKVGTSSELGMTVLDVLKKLSKHVQPGSVTPQGEANQLQKAQLQNAQNSQVLQMMRQKTNQPPGGGEGGAQPGQAAA